eukprot:9944800-Lingulodinium_polyedra.AAC.1
MNSGPSILRARSTAITPVWPCNGGSRPISDTGHVKPHVSTCRCFTRGIWPCFARPLGEPKGFPSWP